MNSAHCSRHYKKIEPKNAFLFTASEIRSLAIHEDLKQIERTLQPQLSKDLDLSVAISKVDRFVIGFEGSGLPERASLVRQVQLMEAFVQKQELSREDYLEPLYLWLQHFVHQATGQRMALVELKDSLRELEKLLRERMAQ